MSLLTEREWNVGYRNEDGDLIELFYNPALECAVQYDRLTGSFSADSLALAARGIEALIANDGRMRLIVGLTLGPSEQEALTEGYDLREQIAARLCAIDLTPDARAQNGLEMLAWMIAQGHLDVKVAIPVGSSGIYHEIKDVVSTIHTTKLREPKTDPHLQAAGERVKAAAEELERLGIADKSGKRVRTDLPGDMREGADRDFTLADKCRQGC